MSACAALFPCPRSRCAVWSGRRPSPSWPPVCGSWPTGWVPLSGARCPGPPRPGSAPPRTSSWPRCAARLTRAFSFSCCAGSRSSSMVLCVCSRNSSPVRFRSSPVLRTYSSSRRPTGVRASRPPGHRPRSPRSNPSAAASVRRQSLGPHLLEGNAGRLGPGTDILVLRVPRSGSPRPDSPPSPGPVRAQSRPPHVSVEHSPLDRPGPHSQRGGLRAGGGGPPAPARPRRPAPRARGRAGSSSG